MMTFALVKSSPAIIVKIILTSQFPSQIDIIIPDFCDDSTRIHV